MPLLSTVSLAPTDPIIGAFLQLGAAVPNLVPGESRQEVLALRQRMASAGHDLRQPLQVIGYALSRLSRSLASERDRAWLQAAMSQTSRLAEGLADLVAAARDEVPDGAFETVGLAELTFDVARDWSLHAVEQGVDLKAMRASGAVRSNRKRLKAIIDNLVGNAIKYAPGGRVRLGFRRSSTGLSLVVIDDGIGISPEDQERIFEAFLQVDGKSEGLGLGLSLVADHCRVLGHTLRLSSEPGRGSCFSVDLGSPVPRGKSRSITTETVWRCGEDLHLPRPATVVWPRSRCHSDTNSVVWPAKEISKMPRLFFHKRRAEASSQDDIGMELPDVDTACKVAHALLTRLVQQDMPDGRPRVWECRTWDEAGAEVYRGELVHRGTRF